MILTGKKVYGNVPVSTIEEFRNKIQPHVNRPKYHPLAQRKIAETFGPLDEIVKAARKRISDGEEEAVVMAEKHEVTVYEIDTSIEWTVRNTAAQIAELKGAKMIEDHESVSSTDLVLEIDRLTQLSEAKQGQIDTLSAQVNTLQNEKTVLVQQVNGLQQALNDALGNT
jgi:pheromone shutdown protein TraB